MSVAGAEHLLADPVAAALHTDASWATRVQVAAIDPDWADTATLVEHSDVTLAESANCILVLGRRGGVERIAAVVVLATTRADVNTVVRKHLDVRKATFLSAERAVAESGMEYGGITPLGLPADWPILVDARVVEQPRVVIGSGLRASKLAMPGSDLAGAPRVEVVSGLAVPLG
ncbi:MAG: YbaK/EbsC family protein [Ornithinimicrobium sp.]|uniref:YbaK/EbsC family protein n=1 Tax=Ornithinimicrobium sp. TaxID=1977084 RepID=UPI003D9B6D89